MWWTRWTRGKDLISLREKGGEGGTRVYNTRDGGEGGGVCFSLSLSFSVAGRSRATWKPRRLKKYDEHSFPRS